MKYPLVVALWVSLGISGQPSLLLEAGDDTPGWFKPGVTPERLRADSDECQSNARMQSPGFGRNTAFASRTQDLEQRCMQSKGYYLARKDGTRIN